MFYSPYIDSDDITIEYQKTRAIIRDVKAREVWFD